MKATHLPWPTSPAGLRVGQPEEVHVWLARLEQPVEEVVSLLSCDELARAQCFKFERDRRRFIVARGVLRIILAAYLDTAPASLCFEYGLQGKPSLASECGQIAFNLSHAEDLALYAIAREGNIGVDLAILLANERETFPLRWVCSDREYAYLMDLPASERQRGFLRLWSRKEALLKATQLGVAVVPLNQVEVLERSVDHPGPFRLGTVPQAPGVWWIEDLALPGNLVAALAADHSFVTPVCRLWDTQLL